MMFQTTLMADPVMASDGFTYERESMVTWMKSHDTSPTTGEPLDHKLLTPNHVVRKLIVSWCEQNGVPVPVAPKLSARRNWRERKPAKTSVVTRELPLTLARRVSGGAWWQGTMYGKNGGKAVARKYISTNEYT